MTDGKQTAEGVGNPSAEETASSRGPFFHRPDWLSFGVTALAALAVYLWTLAPEVTLEYSGSLATGAAYLGVPNPPGYPAWAVYSWLFAKLLPFSNIAWRMAVGSAFAGATMCGLVALMVSRGGLMLLEKRLAFSNWNKKELNRLRVLCGWVAGMSLGLSRAVWREAVIVDTWTIGDLLFTILLCLLMRWLAVSAPRRYLYGALFVFGVSLTGNEEFIVVAPGILLAVFLGDRPLGRDLFILMLVCAAVVSFRLSPFAFFYSPGTFFGFAYHNLPLLISFVVVGLPIAVGLVGKPRAGSEWRGVMACVGCWLAGLAVCLYLPVASMANLPVNWAYPRTADGFWHLIMRGQYDEVRPTAEIGSYLAQLWEQAKNTGRDSGWFYCLIAVFPLGCMRWVEGATRCWLFSLAALIVGAGPLMIATLNPGPDLFVPGYLQPYFIAMDVVLAVLSGLGLVTVGSMVARFGRSMANAPPLSATGGWIKDA